MAIKFLDHFLHIARAMTDMGKEGIGLWNDDDGFFYDVLCMPSGEKVPLRLRSMVGLIPLFAVGNVEQETIDKLPELWRQIRSLSRAPPRAWSSLSRAGTCAA